MNPWAAFAQDAREISQAGTRLLDQSEVAFLATVSGKGRPRMHPFVPKVVEGQLLAFIMDSSPKIADLNERGFYAIHAQPGSEDEEFYIAGRAICQNHDPPLRYAVTKAMGFATGVDSHHILYEFLIDSALWTRWLDFGTKDHRPDRITWTA